MYLSDSAGPTKFGTWTVNSFPNPGTNAPATGLSEIGQDEEFVTTCSDPDGWRDIHTIDFKLLTSDRSVVSPTVQLQFDQDQGLLRLYDPDSHSWHEGHPGDNTVLSTRYVDLRLAGSSVHGHGPTDPTVDLTWELVFKQPAAGRAYDQYVQITDDSGTSTSDDRVGSWVVGASGCIFGDTCPGDYWYPAVQYLVARAWSRATPTTLSARSTTRRVASRPRSSRWGRLGAGEPGHGDLPRCPGGQHLLPIRRDGTVSHQIVGGYNRAQQCAPEERPASSRATTSPAGR